MPKTTLSRRSALRMLGVLGGSIALAACAAPPATPAATAPPAAAAKPGATGAVAQPTASTAGAGAAATPKPGGVLRVGLIGDDGFIEGHNIGSAGNRWDTNWSVWDRLIQMNADGTEPQPMLAESWDAPTDLSQIQLKLRKGVVYSTGREFTSDDVKWNIQRTANPTSFPNPTTYTNMNVLPSRWWTSIETPDKYTIVLKSDAPRPAAFDYFEHMNMLDPVTAARPDYTQIAPVGTGPFVQVEYVPNDHRRYTRNPNYWQSGRPYLDELQVTHFADNQAMGIQLESGALDVIVEPNPMDAVRLKANPAFQVMTNPLGNQVYAHATNVMHAPGDNKLFRQAVQYATDRKRWAETQFAGLSVPKSIPWGPSSLAYDKERENFYAFDLDKARSLMAQSGVTNPQLEFSYQDALNASLGQIMKEDFAKIGITLNLNLQIGPALTAYINSPQMRGFWETVHTSVNTREPSYIMTYSVVFGATINYAMYRDPAYTALINSVTSEPDPAKRRDLYRQINDLLLDQAFAVALATRPHLVVYRTAVHGLRYSGHEAMLETDAWIDPSA